MNLSTGSKLFPSLKGRVRDIAAVGVCIKAVARYLA